MRRALAPSFVVTLALSHAGCRSAEGTSNPPPPPPPPPSATGAQPTATTVPFGNPPMMATRRRHRTSDGGTRPGNSATPIDFSDLETLNPKDAAGGTVFVAADDGCYTAVPDPNPPKNLPTGASPQIVTRVDCPPAMDDPAWDTCGERLVRVKSRGTCYCVPTGGNPPPPPVPNVCPKK